VNETRTRTQGDDSLTTCNGLEMAIWRCVLEVLKRDLMEACPGLRTDNIRVSE
jgi:hypothetical protein